MISQSEDVMTEAVFLELVLETSPRVDHVVDARHTLEDKLAVALTGVGEVTGGGEGMGSTNVDIDVCEQEEVEEAVERVARVCREWDWVKSAVLIQRHPTRREWSVT
jgi:hypothetical protein